MNGYKDNSDAAWALGQMRSAKADIVPQLIRALRHAKQAEHRSTILFVMRDFRPLPTTAIPLLVATLRDKSAQVRNLAVIMLGDMGPNAGEGLPALREALEHDAGRVRVTIGWAMYKITGNVEEAVPILLAELRNPDANVRLDAAQTLGDLGPAAKAAVSSLGRLAQEDPNEKVRETAKAALHVIRGGSG